MCALPPNFYYSTRYPELSVNKPLGWVEFALHGVSGDGGRTILLRTSPPKTEQ